MSTTELIAILRDRSKGEQVFQVVTPDETAYVIEFTRHDSTFPPRDAEVWLQEQNRNGRYLGYKVREHYKRGCADRAMSEAADTIDALRIALADAIRRPMGVVPDSAAGLVSEAEIEAAEGRRPKMPPRFNRPMMIVCPTCGNKRCPKAADDSNECTGSNEPGQAGSNYE